DPLVMSANYRGPLARLNKDLVVYRKDVYIPTFFEKITQFISRTLIFKFLSVMGAATASALMGYPILAPPLAVLLLSFIVGIPSVILIMTKLIKKLLKKYNLESFSLIAYVVSTIIVIFLLLSTIIWLAIPIFTLIGFLVIIFLIVKLLKKYIF
ncbi:MAG: hypothetical protein QMD14_04475, partial [Candidatus Aenigmarchaeota archaeon]|nr:hypothetical protein [Candidatus Aenigmarchaeota archaeon]